MSEGAGRSIPDRGAGSRRKAEDRGPRLRIPNHEKAGRREEERGGVRGSGAKGGGAGRREEERGEARRSGTNRGRAGRREEKRSEERGSEAENGGAGRREEERDGERESTASCLLVSDYHGAAALVLGASAGSSRGSSPYRLKTIETTSSMKLEVFFTPGLYLPGCPHRLRRFNASISVSRSFLSKSPSSWAASKAVLSFTYAK